MHNITPLPNPQEKWHGVKITNSHKGWKIWFNGRHWKSAQWGVEMSHQTFSGIVGMIDRRIQDQADLANEVIAEMKQEGEF